MKKIFNIYLDCIKSSFFDLKRCPLIFVHVFLVFLFWRITSMILGAIPFLNNNILMGFILGLLSILCITVFYYFIGEVSLGRKIVFQDYKNLDLSYFSPIISVAFIIFLFQLLLQSVRLGEQFFLILNVLVFFIFNPVPETIITKRCENFETFAQSFDFVKRNWIAWYFPQVVLFFVFYFLISFNKYIFLNLDFNDILIPSKFLFFSGGYNLTSLFINFFLFVYFFIFRIHLYKRLD